MKNNDRMTKLLTTASAAAFLAGGSLVAGDYGKAVIDDKMPIESSWTICDIFDMNTLYEGDGFVKSISLNGRYHGQAISQQEDLNDTLDNSYHGWQHRRFRLGMDIEFAGDVTLKTSANISDGSGGGRNPLTSGPLFNNWDEFYIDWEPEDNALSYIQIGKQKQKITREFSTSSKKILTIERAAITNEVADKKPWGVTFGYELMGIEQEVGAWITGAGQDNTGLNNYPDGRSNGSLSYRASTPINDSTEVFFDYVFVNNGNGLDPNKNAPDYYGANYEHTFAIGTESEWGRLGLVTDLIFALNREAERTPGPATAIPGGNDTWGAVIMPYYNITDTLQFVTRYAYMGEGEQQRPQRFNRRYNVENYHTFYAGLNYYICDHNLKLMAGYEHATGDLFGSNIDAESGSWMVGLRTYF